MVSSRKRSLLVVTQYFYPEQFRINDMCFEWVKRGYDVTVVTGIPNYPQGKYYDGYGVFAPREEQINGVRVIRLPIVSRGKSKIRLSLNYLSYVLSGFIWSRFTRLKADCVFIHEQSPMTQSLVGVWFGKRWNIPVIHYVTDLWPENVIAVSGIRSNNVIKAIGRMVDYIYKNNALILTSTRSFVPAIQKRGVSEQKLLFWPHYAEEYYTPITCNSNETASNLIPVDDSVINVAFTGNLGEAQGLNILPQTAEICRQKNVHVIFNMIGEGRGKEALIGLVQAHRVEKNFRFIPRQRAEDIPSFLAQCDAGLVILSSSPIFKMSIPTKLQSYMACAIPIIASGEGEMCDIVMQAKAGYCSKTGSPEALAESIVMLASSTPDEIATMRNNAIEYSRSFFNKKVLMDKLEVEIDRVIRENAI